TACGTRTTRACSPPRRSAWAGTSTSTGCCVRAAARRAHSADTRSPWGPWRSRHGPHGLSLPGSAGTAHTTALDSGANQTIALPAHDGTIHTLIIHTLRHGT